MVAHLLTMDGTPPDAAIALCRAYVAGADRRIADITEAHNQRQRNERNAQ